MTIKKSYSGKLLATEIYTYKLFKDLIISKYFNSQQIPNLFIVKIEINHLN